MDLNGGTFHGWQYLVRALVECGGGIPLQQPVFHLLTYFRAYMGKAGYQASQVVVLALSIHTLLFVAPWYTADHGYSKAFG